MPIAAMRNLLLVLGATTAVVAAGSCSVCPNGEPVAKPNKQLSIPEFEYIATCQQLAETLPLLPTSDHLECAKLQSLGRSLCGCPVPQPEKACHLCHGDPSATLSFPAKEIAYIFQNILPGNHTPTCAVVQAYLNTKTNDDDVCRSSQSFLSSYCGCSNLPPPPDNPSCKLCPSGIHHPDKTIRSFGFETCGDLQSGVELMLKEKSPECGFVQSMAGPCGCEELPSEPCNLCGEGSFVPDHMVDREIPFLLRDPTLDGILGATPTCGSYEAHLLSVQGNTDQCLLAKGMGSYCGCSRLPNHCVFCRDHPIEPEYYNKKLHFLSSFEESAGVNPTCEFAEIFLEQIPSDDRETCFSMQERSFLCGCNDGVWMYARTKNETQKRVLNLTPRVTGSLALLGALAIIIDVLSSRDRRRHVYCQIMVGMATFDLITAVPWIMSSSPIPRIVDGGDDSGVQGAFGNEGFCKAQSFLIMLGIATIFYNISLAVYYNLAIVYGWTERRLRRIRWWLHGIPTFLALALAIAGLPYYEWLPLFCLLPYFPLGEHMGATLGLLVMPICLSLLISTILMFNLYWSVRMQYNKSSKYNYGTRGSCTKNANNNNNNKMRSIHAKVLWTSLSYMLAFLVAWPIVVASTLLTGLDGSLPYWGVVLLLLFAPLQGFINAVMYFRPRIISCTFCARRGKDKEVEKEATASDGKSDVDSEPAGMNNDNDQEQGPSDEMPKEGNHHHEEQHNNNNNNNHRRQEEEEDSGSVEPTTTKPSSWVAFSRSGDQESPFAVVQIRTTSIDPSIAIACENPIASMV